MRRMLVIALLPLFAAFVSGLAAERPRSHPALRVPPVTAPRALLPGPTYFVDARNGDDTNTGSKDSPWKTLALALGRLKAGDTLYLRAGIYYENVSISLVGKPTAPITIAAYPGEEAILDGGLRAFFDTPATQWEPCPDGVPGEYRSTRRFPNLRNVVGSFGDSMIGLNTYYHVRDLRAGIEHVEQEADNSDVKSLYCGPGLWYDRETGYLHARFAHTTLAGFENYRGETDARKLPLVLATFRSVPLRLDRAEHVRLYDLTIRGGGYDTVLLDQARHIELDNLTIWCGTYGVRITGTRHLKMHRCGVHGNAPPWATRYEAGFNTYPGRTSRDITRQNTHALLLAQGNNEYEVYAFPFNDDWEISHCEFTDAGADGLYLGGVNVKFHHNLLDHMRDDGIYLSPMYPRHLYLKGGARIEIYQNVFQRALTMLAFGGTQDTRDTVYFYRNIVDMRQPGLFARPKTRDGTVPPQAGHLIGDHGSPPWSSLFCYHNTILAQSPARTSHMALFGASTAERPRQVFNNILVHGSRLPDLQVPDVPHLRADGNLYWQPGLEGKRAEAYFNTYRGAAAFRNSRTVYPPGFESHGLCVDPKFVKGDPDWKVVNDYRLQPGSPAIDAGAEVPADWPDPLRGGDRGKPDIGALPAGAEMLKVGRTAK